MKKNKNAKFFILFLISFLVLSFTFFSFFDKTSNFVFFVSEKPQSALFSIKNFFSEWFGAVFSIKDIIKENAKLKEENKKLTKDVIDLQAIKKENEILREQLKLKKQNGYKIKDAKIVSFDLGNLSDFAVINKGKRDGIKKDMPVILSPNVLLGKISEVYENYSMVLLITDRNSKVNVKLFSEDAKRDVYSGVASGYFGKSLLVDLIEKKYLVLVGDLLVTSGLDGIYPEGLVVGRINSIKTSDNAVFNQAFLSPSFLPLKTNLVFVVTEY